MIMFALANILLLTIAATFLVHPAYESLQMARTSAHLAESRYIAGHRMALAFEDNLLEIELAYQDTIFHYSDLPFALAEVSRLSMLHDLQQLSFLAAEPVVHEMWGNSNILEMRISASYSGELYNITHFLYDLSMVHIQTIDVDFEYNAQVRINLEFSLFATA